MNNIANEKGSINYVTEIPGQHHHSGVENSSTVALPVHAYVHDSVPQSKGFANPGPLCGSTLICLSASSLLMR